MAERAAFAIDDASLTNINRSLVSVENLGANDIYYWYLAGIGNARGTDHRAPDLKLNIIYPCTEKHIAKYSAQEARVVHETPEIYEQYIRPYMKKNRDEGRLNWVFNILEGRQEQEQVIYREPSHPDTGNDEGFLLLPDFNWDRKTITSMHLLSLVERRDIWSVRDLKKKHVDWLLSMRRKLIKAVTESYQGVEEDQLKLYIHYQPTYYHFHIHVVHVMLEAGNTQAVGKALSLDNIISQLATLNDPDRGMADVSLTYTLGEASELWVQIFRPLKEGTMGLDLPK